MRKPRKWHVMVGGNAVSEICADLWYDAREIASRLHGKSPLDLEVVEVVEPDKPLPQYFASNGVEILDLGSSRLDPIRKTLVVRNARVGHVPKDEDMAEPVAKAFFEVLASTLPASKPPLTYEELLSVRFDDTVFEKEV